jgi:hypothetical protein
MPMAKVGGFLRHQGDELTRIWRLARATARFDVFPGLLDDVVSRFFDHVGTALQRGDSPDLAWQGLVGLVRWPPPIAREELAQEWALLVEVLVAACESVNAEPSTTDWLRRCTAVCEQGTLALGDDPRSAPAGVVTAYVFSPMAPRHARADPDERAG